MFSVISNVFINTFCCSLSLLNPNKMNICNLKVISYSTQAMSLTLKQQQPSFIFEKEQLQEYFITFGEKNNMCKSKEVRVAATGALKIAILEHLGTMQIKAKGSMDSGVKCMIACFIMLGSKMFKMLQVTVNWKMSEVLKVVLRPLSCGCKSEDHNGVKIFYVYFKDECSFYNLCKQITEVDHAYDLS